MSKPIQLQNCPQCTAKSKRTGQRCKGPAMNGWKVCRFHGARGGAPRGAAHGNYRHGLHSIEVKQQGQMVGKILREARELLKGFNAHGQVKL